MKHHQRHDLTWCIAVKLDVSHNVFFITDEYMLITEYELFTSTPQIWYERAAIHLKTILLDHAWCERKAAQSALALLNRTADRKIQAQLSRIVREEMRHFEILLPWLKKYKVEWSFLQPPRYGKALLLARSTDPSQRICDTLVISSLIESRSCERFNGLADVLDDKLLASFYRKLMLAEQRHAQVYLEIAQLWGFDEDTVCDSYTRLAKFEGKLILQPEQCVRFHSGMPV